MTEWSPDREICDCRFKIGTDMLGYVRFIDEVSRCQKHKKQDISGKELLLTLWKEQGELAAKRVPDDGV